jgi:arylsulfatase A-like enzyme
MKGLFRIALAGAVVTLILAGTEAVVGYPRPSAASSAFFSAAFLTYLPLAVTVAGLLAALLPKRGLDLWLPFGVGALRMAPALKAVMTAGEWRLALSILVVMVGALVIRRRTESPTLSPPFFFGLTVGIVLPVLASRVAVGSSAAGLLGREGAAAAGVSAGLLTFVCLRAFVARFPRIGPVFLLGPVVSLAWWSAQGAPTAAPPAPLSPASVGRPDIVLVVLDTVRAQALTSYGSARDTMPNLEAFARGSTTFTHAWTDASWTLPAHASLFSGLRLTRHRYDSGFGVEDRSSPDLFLAPRLRRAGYETAAVAANFGVFGREEPLLRGFEHVEAEPLRPFAFRPWFFDLIYAFPRAPWIESQARAFPGPSMRAPWVVERALDFWGRPPKRPRFLFVNLMEAHLPWIPEAEDRGRFGPPGLEVESEQESALGRYLRGGRPTAAETDLLRARYDESLHSLDRSLGRLLSAVSQGPSPDGTIVVVTSDHGESLGEHDRFGHRNSLDDVATRIPLIIRGRGLGAGARRDTPVELADLFLYLAESAGVAVESGLDARPLGERRFVVIEHRPGPQGALPSSYPRGDLSALVDWPFKYSEGPNIAPGLFDLEADPGELRNLAAQEPAQTEAMRAALRYLSGPPSSPGATRDRAAEERLRALGYVR